MTKDVLINISGLHSDHMEAEGDEPIEVIAPASYYYKNGKHYILYEEPVEGTIGKIKNTVKITGESKLEIIKSGLSNAHMVFENHRIHMTEYETPYGNLAIGIHTKGMSVEEQEEKIDVRVQYALDMNSEKVADCSIVMNIKSCS